jgi:hypothetical protein
MHPDAGLARSPLVRSILLLSVLVACGCSKREPTVAAGADAGTIHLAAPDGAAAALDGGAGDDVEPVYATQADAPVVPIAAKLCAALHDMPETKRASCCGAAPGVVVTSECARTLSAALRANAVAIAEEEVDACVAAQERALDGCDWVGPFPLPPPSECLGIVKGRLAAGARCRSNLECSGGARCLGLSPTTVGTCGGTKADGELCGGTVDTLAGYTRQVDVERRHPECKERCIKHRCAAAVAEGGACQVGNDCREGLQCVARRCVAGPLPSKAGEPCPGGECASGLSCIKGRCATRKSAGEECTADFECKGGCLGPRREPLALLATQGRVQSGADTRGRCGPRCDVR